MNKEIQKKWAEKVISIIDDTLPGGNVEFKDWSKYERLLPCSLASIEWIINLSINSQEAARILAQIATYLQKAKADYHQTEIFKKQSLAIYRILFGDSSLEFAISLNDLAVYFGDIQRFAEAETLLIQSLAIKEAVLDVNDTRIATALNNLAWIYDEQAKYFKSFPLRKRSIKIMKKSCGKDSVEFATAIGNLAEWLRSQGKYKRLVAPE